MYIKPGEARSAVGTILFAAKADSTPTADTQAKAITTAAASSTADTSPSPLTQRLQRYQVGKGLADLRLDNPIQRHQPQHYWRAAVPRTMTPNAFAPHAPRGWLGLIKSWRGHTGIAPTLTSKPGGGWISRLVHRFGHAAPPLPRAHHPSIAAHALAQQAILSAKLTASQVTPAPTAEETTLTQITQSFKDRFSTLAKDKTAFDALLKQAFGNQFDTTKAETLRQQSLQGDFSWMPKIQIANSAQLNDLSQVREGAAKAAYVQSENTVYITREILLASPAEAEKYLAEEVGHSIDARINVQDAAGDEGEIFTRLLHGEKLTDVQLQDLRTENDHGIIMINGKRVEVEYGWFKKLTKSISHAFKAAVHIVTSTVKAVVNLAKAAVNVAVGLATFNFDKVKASVYQAIRIVTEHVKDVVKTVKKELKRVWKEVWAEFQKVMQSKLFNAILMICRFIPIPIVQLVVKIIEVVRAAYMAYQGIKNKSFAMVLSAVASVAGSVSQVGATLGASKGFVDTAANIANNARIASAVYNAASQKDFAGMVGTLASTFGGKDVAQMGNQLQQANAVYHAVKSHDMLAVASAGIGLMKTSSNTTINDMADNSVFGRLNQVTLGVQTLKALKAGNFDAAQQSAQALADTFGVSQKTEEARQAKRDAKEKAAEAAPSGDEASTSASVDNPASTDQSSSTEATSNASSHETVDGETSTASTHGPRTVTITKGQGVLTALAQAGLSETEQRAMYGQLALNGQLRFDAKGTPVVQPGQTLTFDMTDLSATKLGGKLISNETSNRNILIENAKAKQAEQQLLSGSRYSNLESDEVNFSLELTSKELAKTENSGIKQSIGENIKTENLVTISKASNLTQTQIDQMTPAQVGKYWASLKGGYMYFGPNSELSKEFSNGVGAKAFEQYVRAKYVETPSSTDTASNFVTNYDYTFTWPRALKTSNLAEHLVGSWENGSAHIANDEITFRVQNTAGFNSLLFGRQLGENGFTPVGKQSSDLDMTIEWKKPVNLDGSNHTNTKSPTSKVRDGFNLTYQQFLEKPALEVASKIQQKLGLDFGASESLENTKLSIENLLNKSYIPPQTYSITYRNAMNMEIAPFGLNRYDSSNLTFHEYHYSTTLCKRSETFCTIEQLSPIVNPYSAPKIFSGFEPVVAGKNILDAGNPIYHRQDFSKGTFDNLTYQQHWFHAGVVANQLEWHGDELVLNTHGYGYGSSIPSLAGNYVIGAVYFKPWQLFVKSEVAMKQINNAIDQTKNQTQLWIQEMMPQVITRPSSQSANK